MTEHSATRIPVVALISAVITYVAGSAFTAPSMMMGGFSEGVGADRERIYWLLGRMSAIVAGLLLMSSVIASVTATHRSTETWWPLLLSVPALVALMHFDYLGMGFR